MALLDEWKAYRDAMGPSGFSWQDDGPLANPDLFGGFWTSWRDEFGQPYALYELASEPTGHFDSSGHQLQPPASVAHGASDGEAGSGGGKTWKTKPSNSGVGYNDPEMSPQLIAERGAATGRSNSALTARQSANQQQPITLVFGALLGSLATLLFVMASSRRSGASEQFRLLHFYSLGK